MREDEKKFKSMTGFDFQNFYNHYKPKLKWHLSSLTKDLELAEDFAQEAFIQGLKKIDTFDNEKSQIQTWITTIARNLVIKSHKEKNKFPTVSMDKEIDDEETSLINFIPHDDDHEEIEKKKELDLKYNLVISEIKKLPEKYNEVLEMRELQNLEYKTISEKLNENLSTIKSRIRKGRQLIQTNIDDKFKKIDEHGTEIFQSV